MSGNSWYNGKTILLINLILLEVVLVVTVNLFITFKTNGIVSDSLSNILLLSAVAAAMVALIALFVVREIVRLSEKEQEAKINEVLLSQSKETVDLLRTQRHDFMNHMQVIHGMLQLNKPDKAMEYLKDVSGETRSGSFLNNIKNPVMNALLSKKIMQAEQSGVKLAIECQSQMEGVRVSFSELSRIVSNLMDNAITAAQQSSDGWGIVELDINEEANSLVISVRNTGAIIPPDLGGKVFDKGYSTKNGDDHGYGLFIVKSLVEQSGGTVRFTSSAEAGTIFVVSIPNANRKSVV